MIYCNFPETTLTKTWNNPVRLKERMVVQIWRGVCVAGSWKTISEDAILFVCILCQRFLILINLMILFRGCQPTIELDYPGNFPSQFFFCSKVRPGNPSLSASDPFALSRGTGCPAFGRFLSLVALESLTAAEHGEPAHRCHSHWASHCMAPFWFKAFSVFPDSKVDTIRTT